MTKRTTRTPVIDLTRITDSHRQQIERVVQIGAKIGLDQEKQHREILKAITRNFDAMIEAVDERTRKQVFAALIDVANVSDAKRIRIHQSFVEGDVAQAVLAASQQRLVQVEKQKDLE